MNPIPGTDKCRRILIVKTSSLGDVCNALPVADVIRRTYPDARIGWVVKDAFRSLIDANPFVDEVVSFPRGSLMRAVRAGLSTRKSGYEVALDMQGLFVSGLISKLSGAKYRISYDRQKEMNHMFINYPVVPAAERNRKAVEVMLDFPRAIGIATTQFRAQPWLCEARRAEAQALLPEGDVAALFCGATTPQRRWPAEKFAMAADALSEAGFSVVFVGSPADAEATQAVISSMEASAESLVGRTDLLTLAGVLARASVVIGGDSGPLHMAVAVGTPVVGVYGPTDPECTGPYGELQRVVYVKQPCSPCYRRPTCGGAYTCMKVIEPQIVVSAALSLVRRETA